MASSNPMGDRAWGPNPPTTKQVIDSLARRITALEATSGSNSGKVIATATFSEAVTFGTMVELSTGRYKFPVSVVANSVLLPGSISDYASYSRLRISVSGQLSANIVIPPSAATCELNAQGYAQVDIDSVTRYVRGAPGRHVIAATGGGVDTTFPIGSISESLVVPIAQWPNNGEIEVTANFDLFMDCYDAAGAPSAAASLSPADPERVFWVTVELF